MGQRPYIHRRRSYGGAATRSPPPTATTTTTATTSRRDCGGRSGFARAGRRGILRRDGPAGGRSCGRLRIQVPRSRSRTRGAAAIGGRAFGATCVSTARRRSVLRVRHREVRFVRGAHRVRGSAATSLAPSRYRYLLSAPVRAPWLSNQAALQLLRFRDCRPHHLARRDQPICITDRGFCVSKMHVVEDQLLIVMTVDIPGRPESWMTLVGLKDQCVIAVSGDVPCVPLGLQYRLLCFPLGRRALHAVFERHRHPVA